MYSKILNLISFLVDNIIQNQSTKRGVILTKHPANPFYQTIGIFTMPQGFSLYKKHAVKKKKES